MSRHPSTAHLLQYFTHAHLPTGPLRDVSSQLGSLARDMVAQLPDGPERTRRQVRVREVLKQVGRARAAHAPTFLAILASCCAMAAIFWSISASLAD